MKAKTLTFLTLTAALVGMAHGASLTEPATVFYGQVINQNAGGELLHEGELLWTISDGTEIHATLAAHDEGRMSYFIEVPHSVLSSGLDIVSGTVPLGAQAADFRHLNISVNGQPASINAPGDYQFNLTATARGATHRLDLTVSLAITDTDGDGMPDWWEELHGLDTDVNDSGLDPDGDGISNLNEYRGGTGPGIDNRGPEILTNRLLAYSDAVTGVMLNTVDLNSSPYELTYTLLELPSHGELRLRTGDALAVGGTFTQEDVEGGHLVYDHETGSAQTLTSFKLRVQDDTASAVGEIEIEFYDQTGMVVVPERQRMAEDLQLAREQSYIVWDMAESTRAQHLSQPDDLLPVTITGGSEADELSGGAGTDIIRGGEGADQMTGLDGADRFVVLGSDQITDFNPAEGDVVDFTTALEGTSTSITDYLKVTGGSEIAVDRNGDGSGFKDMLVMLDGQSLDLEKLYSLVTDGRIVAGSLILHPLVSIEATTAQASEIGLSPGTFTITRLGSLTKAVVVSLQISGTAVNGVDYSFLPGSVTIPAGARSLTISVTPFADTLTELSEVVELRVLDSAAYTTGGRNVAQVSIENLKPRIRLEALESVAAVDGAHKGVILIERDGDTASSVLLRFTIGGSARSGVDYTALPAFLTLAANQTFALIDVTPLSGAQISGGVETVTVSLNPNASYAGGDPTLAQVSIVPELLRFEDHPSGDLLDYGFGQSVPKVEYAGGFLTMSYLENVAAVDLDYIVEISTDLITWRSATGEEIRRMSALETSPSLRVYQSNESGPSQFMRVKLLKR
jgi:hypothetical protein